MVLILDEPGVLDAARALLGKTTATLPDATLEQDVIGPAAERTVRGWVEPPAYEDRDAAEQAAMQRAVSYQTAANWLATQRGNLAMTSEQFSSQYRYTRSAVDVDAWIVGLREDAAGQVADLLPDAAEEPTGLFITAPGGRGESYTRTGGRNIRMA